MDISHRLAPPGPGHPLGTDQYGRDILSRLMRAAPAAVGTGLGATALGALVGVPLGLLAGYYRGWLDEVAMRLMDGLYAFPFILFALLVVAGLGPGLGNAVFAIGLVGSPVFARLARAEALGLRERQFVEAARAAGARDLTILLRHILPNALPTLAVQASLAFSGAVLAEAALSFLGLGTQPPHPSWGRMLEEAQSYLTISPWPALFPGLAIAVTVLGFNLLGDGLRDRL
ncbi:MAG: ABC transporter permease [Acetobacteraceae bacterium]|nr:ABC transporter permease [Acetobacteraceae bacterium]